MPALCDLSPYDNELFSMIAARIFELMDDLDQASLISLIRIFSFLSVRNENSDSTISWTKGGSILSSIVSRVKHKLGLDGEDSQKMLDITEDCLLPRFRKEIELYDLNELINILTVISRCSSCDGIGNDPILELIIPQIDKCISQSTTDIPTTQNPLKSEGSQHLFVGRHNKDISLDVYINLLFLFTDLNVYHEGLCSIVKNILLSRNTLLDDIPPRCIGIVAFCFSRAGLFSQVHDVIVSLIRRNNEFFNCVDFARLCIAYGRSEVEGIDSDYHRALSDLGGTLCTQLITTMVDNPECDLHMIEQPDLFDDIYMILTGIIEAGLQGTWCYDKRSNYLTYATPFGDILAVIHYHKALATRENIHNIIDLFRAHGLLITERGIDQSASSEVKVTDYINLLPESWYPIINNRLEYYERFSGK